MLFTDEHYKDMTVEAKVLYSLLLDRMSLSARNGWMDGERRVFIYFTLEDVMGHMNCGHNKAVRIFSDLEQIGLIERKKQGQGKPAKIYVKNFVIPMDPDQPPSETPPTPTRPEMPPTPSFPSPSNNTSEMKTAEKTVPSEKGFSAPPAKGSHEFPKANGNNTEINNTKYNNTDLSIPPSPPRNARFHGERTKGTDMDG